MISPQNPANDTFDQDRGEIAFGRSRVRMSLLYIAERRNKIACSCVLARFQRLGCLTLYE